MIHGTKEIVKAEGFLGIYRGLSAVVRALPTSSTSTRAAVTDRSCLCVALFQILKQGANSAVRFTTYSSLKQLVQGSAPAGQPLPGGVTFGLGAVAGVVTVCASASPCALGPSDDRHDRHKELT